MFKTNYYFTWECYTMGVFAIPSPRRKPHKFVCVRNEICKCNTYPSSSNTIHYTMGTPLMVNRPVNKQLRIIAFYSSAYLGFIGALECFRIIGYICGHKLSPLAFSNTRSRPLAKCKTRWCLESYFLFIIKPVITILQVDIPQMNELCK